MGILIIECSLFIFCLSMHLITYKRMKKDNNRMDLLSRENSKLIEENDNLRDKLKNLGFTEIDLKKYQ